METISLAIGVFGILIALYQGFEKKKLTNFVRSQSWYIYTLANVATAEVQTSLRKYKDHSSAHIDIELLESLSKSDAFSQSVFNETIRQIQLSEPTFNLQRIIYWQNMGKINKDHTPIFLKLIPTEHPSKIAIWWHDLKSKKNKPQIPQQKPEIK